MDWTTYVGVFFLATIKFFLAVLAGLLQGYNLFEMLVVVGTGSILSVFLYLYLGKHIKRILESTFRIERKRRSFSQRRKIVKFWTKYGLPGTSFLIPIISPQVAIGIAIAFQEKPRRIAAYMTGSILFWILLSFFFKESLLKILG